ncbi:MAG TPA: molybdopterin converting factor [Gammaproteobacteria bacterium]|nr:molybdopterin converting factor [Gammaproteobacteria bacterium]
MKIEILTETFEPLMALQNYQQQVNQVANSANSVFIGRMREQHMGNTVEQLYLEHYPGMTERVLRESVVEAQRRWQINDVLILHRVGQINPAEAIVLLAVWSVHRADSIQANEFLIEILKSRAPFWKKEILKEGERWIESNTPGR